MNPLIDAIRPHEMKKRASGPWPGLAALLLIGCLALSGCGEDDGSSFAASAPTTVGLASPSLQSAPGPFVSPQTAPTASPAPDPAPSSSRMPQPDPTVSGVPATLVVDEQVLAHDQARLLLGMSFDGRTSLTQTKGGVTIPIGYYSHLDGSLLPAVGAAWSSQRPGTFRFPGNAYWARSN